MIAIITAFKEEVAGYIKRNQFILVDRIGAARIYCSKTVPTVVVSEGGIGKHRAQENTKLIVERFRPDLIISAGFAGGTTTGMRSGDVFVCDQLMAVSGPPFLWNHCDAMQTPDIELFASSIRGVLGDQLQFRTGACLTASTFVPTRVMKNWIGMTFNVNLIDMESYWVNEIACSLNTSCIVVRAVFDPVEQSMPRFIGETLEESKLTRTIRAFRHLLSNPADTPYLVKLACQTRVVSNSLTETLENITSVKTTT